MKQSIKNCKLCDDEFEAIGMGHSRIYCFVCSPSYTKGDWIGRNITYTALRIAIKKELVKRKGGKCVYCGYDKCLRALHFHHRNPNEKEFTISKILSKGNPNIAKVFREAEKCDLVCANCHAELHDE